MTEQDLSDRRTVIHSANNGISSTSAVDKDHEAAPQQIKIIDLTEACFHPPQEIRDERKTSLRDSDPDKTSPSIDLSQPEIVKFNNISLRDADPDQTRHSTDLSQPEIIKFNNISLREINPDKTVKSSPTLPNLRDPNPHHLSRTEIHDSLYLKTGSILIEEILASEEPTVIGPLEPHFPQTVRPPGIAAKSSRDNSLRQRVIVKDRFDDQDKSEQPRQEHNITFPKKHRMEIDFLDRSGNVQTAQCDSMVLFQDLETIIPKTRLGDLNDDGRVLLDVVLFFKNGTRIPFDLFPFDIVQPDTQEAFIDSEDGCNRIGLAEDSKKDKKGAA